MKHDLFVPSFANPAGSPIRELFPYLSKPGMISFAGGYPSPALFDAEGLTDATNRVMAGGASILQYGATEGSAPLREQILGLCATRGIRCETDELLVTTGSQQAFDLLVRVLIEPGDAVLLETPAYPAAIQALRLAGAVIHEVPMDAEGLQTTTLEEILDRLPPGKRPKLLYTVPTFSNPRGTLLPQSRRQALVALARRHGFLIIEDDPYGELAFTDDVPDALYVVGGAGAGDATDNPVVYLSSLSKTVAPAVRIGWMIAPREVVRRCTIAKQTVDLCTSPLNQLVAAEYLRSGRYPQTVRSACAEYARRVDAMASALEALLGSQLRFARPQGGMFLWAETRVAVDPKQLFDAAVNEGVLFVPGAAFHPTVLQVACMRLSFASPTVDEIREGVTRLARAFRSCSAVAQSQRVSSTSTSPVLS